MPSFEENTFNVFFEMFDKVAIDSGWPEDKRVLIVQTALTGKAQRAVAALDQMSVWNMMLSGKLYWRLGVVFWKLTTGFVS